MMWRGVEFLKPKGMIVKGPGREGGGAWQYSALEAVYSKRVL